MIYKLIAIIKYLRLPTTKIEGGGRNLNITLISIIEVIQLA